MTRFVGLDPSTKTGFVALDESGKVIEAKEITGIGSVDPKRMRSMIIFILDHIKPNDFIAIEGFGYASQQAVQNGGIGWGIRMPLYAKGFKYYEVAPNAVKKFVNVSGWKGEDGKKLRLKDKEKKLAVKKAVYEHYGFQHSSDNVVDAFIIAQIAKAIKDPSNLTTYQQEVIDTILNPLAKKPKKKKVKAQ